jgi:hypothetical protein
MKESSLQNLKGLKGIGWGVPLRSWGIPRYLSLKKAGLKNKSLERKLLKGQLN